jgi:hypothetical protein
VDDVREHYQLARESIPADRWVDVYGWSIEEAANMDGQSSEVRLYHVAADGTKRDLAPNKDGGFEFGYGGTGPHESARAIVGDIQATEPELSPQDLRETVPEVFEDVHDAEQVIVYLTDVRIRLGLDPEADG